MKSMLALLLGAALSGQVAQAADQYELTITNGANMPLSPAAIYVRTGQVGLASPGTSPTNGFIRLCQMGDPELRLEEVRASAAVTFATRTTSPILPGESRTLEVTVENPLAQSLHIETMYGKTKDICGVGMVGSHSLYALRRHVTSEFLGKDDVFATGAFEAPALPIAGADAACAETSDVVACLRELSLPNRAGGKVRFFAPYLPSVVNFLESKYGAEEALSLIIPDSGAIRFRLRLKH